MNLNPFNTSQMYTNPYTPPPINPYVPKSMSAINSGIIWVQGIEGAKAYQIPQNSNVILMDSEKNRMYIKTSDNIGMCNLRIFDFTEITETSSSNNSIVPQMDMSQFVTREELTKILQEYNEGAKNEQSVSTTKPSKSNKSVISE